MGNTNHNSGFMNLQAVGNSSRDVNLALRLLGRFMKKAREVAWSSLFHPSLEKTRTAPPSSPFVSQREADTSGAPTHPCGAPHLHPKQEEGEDRP